MNMWEFFNEHWFIAWCALWLGWPAIALIYMASHVTIFKLPNRILRTIKVCARGWPPEHIDVDGDWRKSPKK